MRESNIYIYIGTATIEPIEAETKEMAVRKLIKKFPWLDFYPKAILRQSIKKLGQNEVEKIEEGRWQK
uniref:Uncharacterized protein n=1 Tax=Caldisericum exile TaxID=693075 RepID=A0A7C4TXF8_9BACT